MSVYFEYCVTVWVILLLFGKKNFIFCAPRYDPDGMKLQIISCNHTGMEVRMTSSNVFKGVIYTQGNTYNPNCRYEAPDLGTKDITYFIPLTDCGNLLEEEESYIYVTNTLIAQKNRIVETNTDVVQRLSCKVPVSHLDDSRLLAHSRHPIHVYEPGLESWMDLYSGTKILGVDAPNKLSVGEDFSIIVQLKDGGKYKDLEVEKCWAHEGEQIDTSKRVVEIFNLYECRYSDWIPGFTISKGIENVSNVMAIGLMKAFKFVESNNLHITCSIKVCDNFCMKLCEIPKSKKTTDYPLRVKRSNSESNSGRDLDERHRLMKATIKALGARLIKRNRGTSTQNDTLFLRRSEQDEKVFPISSYETVVTSQNVGVNDTIGTTEVVFDVKNKVSDVTGNNVYAFNLTNNVIIFTDKEYNYRYEYRNGRKSSASCVAYAGYLIATITLTFFLLSLLIACIGLILCLKNEKRKNRKIAHDKYMLYSLY